MTHSRDCVPNTTESATPNALSTLSPSERESFLRFVRARLTADDPLKYQIDVAVELISRGVEPPVDHGVADEVKETEIAAWRAMEAQNNAAHRESARITEEYRCARVGRMEQLLSGCSVDRGEWRAIQKEFEAAHEQNPELDAWVYLNECPPPAGPGSLQFRELAHRAAWSLARVTGDDAWKLWLDVLVGYLLINDADGEYLQRMPGGHLDRPEGTTPETHPGVLIHGEIYRICHLCRASELCCSWLRRYPCEDQPATGRSQREAVTIPSLGRPAAGSKSAEDRSVTQETDAEDENPLLAAMRRQGLNAPRLALQVKTVLKRRGVTKVKADRTTIYRLLHGKTKRPHPAIWSAVCDVLNLSAK